MGTFENHGVCQKRLIRGLEFAEKGPVGLRWVDANNGDKDSPESADAG